MPIRDPIDIGTVETEVFRKEGKTELLTREAADIKNAEAWEEAKADAIKKGCVIDENGHIVGINAKTGLPDYEAARTIKFADVEEDSGKFYVPIYTKEIERIK